MPIELEERPAEDRAPQTQALPVLPVLTRLGEPPAPGIRGWWILFGMVVGAAAWAGLVWAVMTLASLIGG